MFEPFRCGAKGKASYRPLALSSVPVVRSRNLARSSTLDACSSVSGREGDICVALVPGWRVRPEAAEALLGTFGATKSAAQRSAFLEIWITMLNKELQRNYIQ